MSTLKKAILVPIDFTEESYTPLRQAYRITELLEGKIVLLHILPDLGFFSKIFTDADEEKLHAAAHEKLEELAHIVEKERGIETEILVAKGKVAEKICEVAEMIEASLIVMGTHTNLTMKEKLMGSNALQVVKTAKCPVETVRIGKNKEFCRRLILPLDLTKESKEKVKIALEIAKIRKREGVIILVVSVAVTDDEFVINKLTRQLKQVESLIKSEGIECTSTLINNKDAGISESILNFSYINQGDIIIIMTQQSDVYNEFFIGSSAQYIIDKSEVPVLSIVPMKRKDTSVFRPYY